MLKYANILSSIALWHLIAGAVGADESAGDNVTIEISIHILNADPATLGNLAIVRPEIPASEWESLIEVAVSPRSNSDVRFPELTSRNRQIEVSFTNETAVAIIRLNALSDFDPKNRIAQISISAGGALEPVLLRGVALISQKIKVTMPKAAPPSCCKPTILPDCSRPAPQWLAAAPPVEPVPVDAFAGANSIRVSAPTAPLKLEGGIIIAHAVQGSTLPILERHEHWIWTRVVQRGTPVEGWILKKYVQPAIQPAGHLEQVRLVPN